MASAAMQEILNRAPAKAAKISTRAGPTSRIAVNSCCGLSPAYTRCEPTLRNIRRLKVRRTLPLHPRLVNGTHRKMQLGHSKKLIRLDLQRHAATATFPRINPNHPRLAVHSDRLAKRHFSR